MTSGERGLASLRWSTPRSDRGVPRTSIVQIHLAAALACMISLGVSLPAAAAPDEAPPGGEQRAKRWRGYLNVSPTTFVGLSPLYAYNLDGGGQLTRSRFKLQVGGWFQHALRPGFHYFTLGPIVRVGGGSERLFGYFLAHAGLVAIRGFIEGFTRSALGVNGGVGGGLMGSVHPHVSLGFEASGAMGFADAYLLPELRLRLFIGFVF